MTLFAAKCNTNGSAGPVAVNRHPRRDRDRLLAAAAGRSRRAAGIVAARGGGVGAGEGARRCQGRGPESGARAGAAVSCALPLALFSPRVAKLLLPPVGDWRQ